MRTSATPRQQGLGQQLLLVHPQSGVQGGQRGGDQRATIRGDEPGRKSDHDDRRDTHERREDLRGEQRRETDQREDGKDEGPARWMVGRGVNALPGVTANGFTNPWPFRRSPADRWYANPSPLRA